MSLALLWRGSLALVFGLLLGFLALRFISRAPDSHPPAPQAATLTPRLALIRQASTGELISLQIAPFEVGPNDFRVTLLNPIGKPQKLTSARLRFSRLELEEGMGEVDSKAAGQSRDASYTLEGPGWWQIDVMVNAGATATFYLKLDLPSNAPSAFAPPDYNPDPEAEDLFKLALTRYEGLGGLKTSEELTSGDPGLSGFGIWFITNINSNREGYHATSLSMDQGGSELYGNQERQCFRQAHDDWQCSAGASPIGPFELSYLRNATGFKKGREEAIHGEMTQVVLFYNRSQGAWFAWWIGQQTHNVYRQAMVANGHFMLDHYSDHDSPVSIQPKDLPPR
jgi:hypothetical protein